MAIKIVLALYLVFTLFMAGTNNTSARELLERDCLNAREEIKSCIFNGPFLEIGEHCCHGVTTFLSHQCQPASLPRGYTDVEADALCEYCGGCEALPAPSPTPLSNEDCLNDGDDIKGFCVPFIDDGYFDVGPSCCKAFINFVSHQCQPAMLTSVGYTDTMCKYMRDTCLPISGPAPSPTPSNNKDVCSDWK